MLHLLQKATKKLQRSKLSGNLANVTAGAQENFRLTDNKKQKKKICIIYYKQVNRIPSFGL
jgi:hypothetical protein